MDTPIVISSSENSSEEVANCQESSESDSLESFTAAEPSGRNLVCSPKTLQKVNNWIKSCDQAVEGNCDNNYFGLNHITELDQDFLYDTIKIDGESGILEDELSQYYKVSSCLFEHKEPRELPDSISKKQSFSKYLKKAKSVQECNKQTEKLNDKTLPVSPESEKKKELCSYLQLMKPTEKKTVTILQNRRSVRVKNLSDMQKKKESENKLDKNHSKNGITAVPEKISSAKKSQSNFYLGKKNTESFTKKFSFPRPSSSLNKIKIDFDEITREDWFKDWNNEKKSETQENDVSDLRFGRKRTHSFSKNNNVGKITKKRKRYEQNTFQDQSYSTVESEDTSNFFIPKMSVNLEEKSKDFGKTLLDYESFFRKKIHEVEQITRCSSRNSLLEETQSSPSESTNNENNLVHNKIPKKISKPVRKKKHVSINENTKESFLTRNKISVKNNGKMNSHKMPPKKKSRLIPPRRYMNLRKRFDFKINILNKRRDKKLHRKAKQNSTGQSNSILGKETSKEITVDSEKKNVENSVTMTKNKDKNVTSNNGLVTSNQELPPNDNDARPPSTHVKKINMIQLPSSTFMVVYKQPTSNLKVATEDNLVEQNKFHSRILDVEDHSSKKHENTNIDSSKNHKSDLELPKKTSLKLATEKISKQALDIGENLTISTLDTSNLKQKQNQHLIYISADDGPIVKIFYFDFNLVICQMNLVSFWEQTALGNVLGAQNMWIERGQVQRLTMNNNCIFKESLEMVFSTDISVAYIELWIKEHESDFRQGPVADVFAVVYFWRKGYTKLDKKVLQLENIKGFADDVQYSILKSSPSIIVSWHLATSPTENKKTFIHIYQMAPDFQSLISTRKFESVDHYVSSLHNIISCDSLIMGCGENKITMWNIEHGYVAATIEMSDIKSPLSTLWVKCDRGFLFTLQQCVDKELRLIAIHGMNHSWKKLASYVPPKDYDRLKGVWVENGLILACYDKGIVTWNAQSAEIVMETSQNEPEYISGKYIINIVNDHLNLKHAMTYLLSTEES